MTERLIKIDIALEDNNKRYWVIDKIKAYDKSTDGVVDKYIIKGQKDGKIKVILPEDITEIF